MSPQDLAGWIGAAAVPGAYYCTAIGIASRSSTIDAVNAPMC